MTPLAMPANLTDAVARGGSRARRDWYARLPELVGGLARRWSLRLGPPFQPGGECSCVAPARDDGAGRGVVLMVGWTHDEALHEADGLRAWGDRGAVRLHDVYVDGPTTALLMQLCRPGTPLGEALPEPEQEWSRACCGDSGTSRRGTRSVRWSRWAAGGHRRRGEVRRASRAARSRPRPDRAGAVPRAAGVGRVVLATDLHAGNVLAAAGEPWLLIDPKPYVGDPAYDVLQHLVNCGERLLRTLPPKNTFARVLRSRLLLTMATLSQQYRSGRQHKRGARSHRHFPSMLGRRPTR